MPLPAAADFTGASVTEAQFKTAITNFRDYVANLETVAPGAILPFARATAPAGWLKANGAAVSRATYSALFAAIGTTFGVGDGSTTFNLPDLRGEFVRGLDDSRGVDTGRVLGSAQNSQNLSHAHACTFQSYPSGSAGAKGGYGYTETELSKSSFGANTGNTGGAESRPRNIALLACIKY